MVFPLTSMIFLVLYFCQNSGFILVARTIGVSLKKNKIKIPLLYERPNSGRPSDYKHKVKNKIK